MLLAGPILRRVDAMAVNFWIALDEDVAISSILKEDTNEVTGQSSAIKHQIGIKLFIYIITFVPTVALQNGKVYSYDLKKNEVSILADLLTLDIPLGYSKNALPSFVLPAAETKNLVVAHGSCRKMHGDGPEALSNLDDLVKEHLKSPDKRIQQLFLTGDQVYADEIPLFALWSITKMAKVLINEKEDLPLQAITIEGKGYPDKRIMPFDAIPGLRSPLLREYAKMTTTGNSHLFTFGEYCLAHLHAWSQDSWQPEFLAAVNNATAVENTDNFIRLTGLTLENYNSREYLHPNTNFFKKFLKDLGQNLASELLEVKNFLDNLPKVRRVLANTPTYMIFDDHEITDDWNISMKWKNQVYSTPLGKTIIRNGLMAYALCQDLGNVPEEYKKAGSKKNALIGEIINYAKAENFSVYATDTTDRLLGIATPATQPEVTWHFHLESGPKVKTLFLDTRNRRGFSNLNTRPELLDTNAFKEQFKFPVAPKADDMLLVISACPAIGLSVFEEMIYPLATSVKGIASGDNSFASGQLLFDNEAWYLNAKAYEELLSQMSVFKQVVIFSGDVHYGFTTFIDYWKKAETQPSSRFIQLVSSSMKNLWKKNTRLFQSGFVQGIFSGFGGKAEKFGWAAPPSLTCVDMSLVNRRRLRETPAVIDNFGLQNTVKITPETDWRYRLSVAFDDRTDENIGGISPESLLGDTFNHQSVEDIRRISSRFTEDFRLARSRRLMYATHVCVVSFKEEKLVHTFLYRRADDIDVVLKMVHEVPLAASTEEEKRRPEFPTA